MKKSHTQRERQTTKYYVEMIREKMKLNLTIVL